MRKLIYFSIILFSGISFLFSSCLDDDDSGSINEEWKKENEARFLSEANKRLPGDDARYLYSGWHTPYDEYKILDSVLWRHTSVITDSDREEGWRINKNGNPEFTDTVACRYTGWYYDGDTKIIFDSTEEPLSGTTINPNKVEKRFAVSSVVEGFRTALQNMHEGDEVEIVIPWQLGYGSYGNGTSIVGYTTLYFNVKLMKIIPLQGKD